MSALPRTWRPFVFSSICFSVALVITAFAYANLHPADPWLLTSALPAFLVEGLCFLGATLERPRQYFASLAAKRQQGALLWLSALLPYVVFSLAAGTFEPRAFGLLAALTAGFLLLASGLTAPMAL